MGNIEAVIKFLTFNSISYEENVNLKKKTWIHRGGMCRLFIIPINSSQLENLVQFLYQHEFKFQLLGHTSNVYILNSTNIPIIVSTMKCNKYEVIDKQIYCEAGAGVIRLSNDMINQGIRGFEYLTGLPGTIGAAICNNSSCKENSISGLLISAEVMLSNGQKVTMTAEDMDFKFRTSVFKEKRIEGTILRATLRAERDDADKLMKIAYENNEERKRILEGHAKNLGCTVNRCFINGKMPLRYSIPSRIFYGLLKICRVNESYRRKLSKNFLCFISGYNSIARYISNINGIIFVWHDEGADKQFPRYLEFMRKVYKTDKVEIEVI